MNIPDRITLEATIGTGGNIALVDLRLANNFDDDQVRNIIAAETIIKLVNPLPSFISNYTTTGTHGTSPNTSNANTNISYAKGFFPPYFIRDSKSAILWMPAGDVRFNAFKTNDGIEIKLDYISNGSEKIATGIVNSGSLLLIDQNDLRLKPGTKEALISVIKAEPGCYKCSYINDGSIFSLKRV